MAKRIGAQPSGAKRGDVADTPDLGHLVWLWFTPQAGREQAGRRPALVLTPRTYNSKTGLCVVCPVTNQVKGYAFEVALPDGFPVQGVILADHIKSADWPERQCEYICQAPPEVLDDVHAKIKALFGM